MKTVAIIGGGFSGTMAAVNLARLSESPLRVELINDRYPLARGVAYGTTRSEHLLNVAARNMSAVPDYPDHLLDWLRTRSDYRDTPETQLRETFLPRHIYGDYLANLLLTYLRPIDRYQPTEIRLHAQEAIDVIPQDEDQLHVQLRDGTLLAADRVLLATGNQPPARLPAADDFAHSAYCSDPWQDWTTRLPETDAPVVILGSGLTMVDAFLTLQKLDWQGPVIVVSKNGRIPQAHFRGIEYPDFLPPHPERLGLQKLVALLEDHCGRLQRSGENPGILVDRLRPFTQRIWQQLSQAEKQEFLQHYASRWNVIRHRIAQPIHQRLTEAITEGRVRVVRGTVQELRAAGERVEVALAERGGRTSVVSGGLVLNCTGPDARFSGTEVPLFRNLLNRGLVRPDELDMGLQVGPDFAAVDAVGERSPFLFAIGPLMRGTLWETTAVPELRGQAMRVAQVLVDEAQLPVPGQDYRFSVEDEHVIEYYI